jgi:hypothetical protein
MERDKEAIAMDLGIVQFHRRAIRRAKHYGNPAHNCLAGIQFAKFIRAL